MAVLPLANLSGDSSQNYFADGMTEELITSLSKIRPLRVISRMSTIQYKGTTKSLKDIAQELNVDAVLSGSVLRSGDRVRINVQLIHGATDTHLWAESYDRALSDVLALQSDVGRAIASEIRINLTPVEKGMFASSKALNPKALESYLRGRDFFYQGRNQKTADKYNEFLLTSIRHFEQAISIEPNYALAYCGLSRANHWLASSTRPDLWPAAKDAALKAIQIDEEEAEGHAALAFILQVHDWDLSRSEREYKRALELNPSYSDAHGGYSLVLTAVGRHDEAIRHSALGIELDPLTLPLRTIHAYLFIYARQYEQAIKSYQDLQQKFSDGDVSSRLGEAYIYSRKYEEGIKVFHEAGGSSAPRSAIVAWAYARAGKRDEANKILAAAIESLASGGRVSKLRIAWAYAALGDNDQAFAWLEKAYSDHADGLIYLKVHPAFESLHSDPRFKDLVRRIGLPE